jgi:hypothetical protein
MQPLRAEGTVKTIQCYGGQFAAPLWLTVIQYFAESASSLHCFEIAAKSTGHHGSISQPTNKIDIDYDLL